MAGIGELESGRLLASASLMTGIRRAQKVRLSHPELASIVIIFRKYDFTNVRAHLSQIDEKRLIELYNVPDERLALF